MKSKNEKFQVKNHEMNSRDTFALEELIYIMSMNENNKYLEI